MNLKIISKDKKIDKFNRDAIMEYSKRLTRYCKLDFTVMKNDDLILKSIGEKDYVILIDRKSTLISSEQLADKLEQFAIGGKSNLVFLYNPIINKNILDRVNERISISKMEFDNGLMSVMIHEQIYRAYRIINKEPYHK